MFTKATPLGYWAMKAMSQRSDSGPINVSSGRPIQI